MANARQKRAEYVESGSHLPDQIVRSDRGRDMGRMQATERLAFGPFNLNAKVPEKISHEPGIGQVRHGGQDKRLFA
jgi:hypothetical protein